MDDFIIEKATLIKYVGHDADVIIPNTVKRITDDAIDLAAIKTLTIPKSVRRIGNLAPFVEKGGPTKEYRQELPNQPTIFFDCNLSDYLRIKNLSAWIFNLSCKVMIRQQGKYVCLQQLKEIVIPNDMAFLEDQLCYCKMEKVVFGRKVRRLWASFYMCCHLKDVVFNDCLESIGEDAFSDCLMLGPVIKLPASVKTVGLDSFRNCQKLETIYASEALNTETFIHNDPFGKIKHEVFVLDTVTKKEIYVYKR